MWEENANILMYITIRSGDETGFHTKPCAWQQHDNLHNLEYSEACTIKKIRTL
jgi:hypothetical protein